MDTDHDLLFGALAVRSKCIDPSRLADVYRSWLAEPNSPLADLLVSRGLLTPADKAHVDTMLAQELASHGGDAAAALERMEVQHVSWADVYQPTLQQTAVPPPTPRPEAPSPAAGAATRFQRLHKHAAGGIGQVWLARDNHLDRDVALKELRPDKSGDDRLRLRFLAEARITGRLEHPGIVPVYELAQTETGPFYVMRFVHGRTLSADIQAYHRKLRAEQAGTLDLNALLQAFVNICQAVAFAHSRNVIHRDLKSANVILGDFGEVMVLDWGLAKFVHETDAHMEEAASSAAPVPLSSELTMAGQVLGTPAYMAPEQAAAGLARVDFRSDVYGLGAILYEILTGKPPFTSGPALTIQELLRKVREEEPPRPRELCPGVPRALEGICLRALAKKPEDRHASAADIAHDVQCWLADEPIPGFREPLPARVGRWARRHKPLVAGAAALLVTAVAGLAASTILIGKEQARTEAMALKAEQNFRKARAVVDRFFVKISEERLLNEPGLQPLRRELLEMARSYYEGFEKDRGRDPEVRADLARTLFMLARVTESLGDSSQALTAIHQAADIFEEITAANPGDAGSVFWLARCRNREGALYAALPGKLDDAERAFGRARALLENLPPAEQQNPEVRKSLADSLNDLGLMLQRRQQRDGALVLLRAALKLNQETAGRDPENPAWQDELAQGHTNLANLLNDIGRTQAREKRTADAKASWTEAEHHYRKAWAIHKKLTVQEPKVIEYQRNLAKSSMNLGRFYRSADKARAFLDDAARLRRRLAEQSPKVTTFQRELGESYVELGLFWDRQRRQGGNTDQERARETALAAEAFGKARRLFADLARQYPETLAFTEELGWACSIQADFVQADDPKSARALYLEAVTLLERALHKNPDSAMARISLRNAFWGLADITRQDSESALKYWRRALELDDGSQRPLIHAGLVAAWLKLSYDLASRADYKRAVAEADALAREPSLSGPVLWNLASIYVGATSAALTKNKALAEENAAKTVAVLARAHALGFFRDPTYRRRLEELGRIPIYGNRPDFQKLLK
jgi:tRNA A-37 threonylcarbamoyl transferase component Bud32